MARLTEPFDGLPDQEDFEDGDRDIIEVWRAHMAAEREVLDGLYEVSDGLDTEHGEIVGAMISFPVADGKAFYRVVDDEPFTLQHVPYGDGYAIPAAHVRGLRPEDVIQHVEGRRRLAELAGGE